MCLQFQRRCISYLVRRFNDLIYKYTMINNSEIQKILNEHRMAKSDFARLKALTELQN